ncbi:hypothetical protein VPHD85_0057 [Vibrio phage D85]
MLPQGEQNKKQRRIVMEFGGELEKIKLNGSYL